MPCAQAIVHAIVSSHHHVESPEMVSYEVGKGELADALAEGRRAAARRGRAVLWLKEVHRLESDAQRSLIGEMTEDPADSEILQIIASSTADLYPVRERRVVRCPASSIGSIRSTSSRRGGQIGQEGQEGPSCLRGYFVSLGCQLACWSLLTCTVSTNVRHACSAAVRFCASVPPYQVAEARLGDGRSIRAAP